MRKIIMPLLFISAVSCNNTKKMSETSSIAKEDAGNNSAVNMMQQNGTDFLGNGSVPVSWQLEMNYDDTVRFSAEDGLTLKVAYNQLKKNISAQQSSFSAKAGNGNMTIIITDGTCTIPTHRQVYNKAITVTFNGKSYTGCGSFLADQRLNNKWILYKIGSTVIHSEDYNKVPVMQFDLTKQQLSGNDGCNSIGGKIEVQGNRIQFGALISTKMACMKKSIESIISTQVSGKLVNYYFKDGNLYLYLPDDSLLVFKAGE